MEYRIKLQTYYHSMINLVKVALAQGIVPDCEATSTCDFNKLLELAANVVSFMIRASFLIAIVFLVVGGFKYLTSGGNSEKVKSATSTLTAAVVGILIILVGWLVLNFVFTQFTTCDSWNIFDISAVNCK